MWTWTPYSHHKTTNVASLPGTSKPKMPEQRNPRSLITHQTKRKGDEGRQTLALRPLRESPAGSGPCCFPSGVVVGRTLLPAGLGGARSHPSRHRHRHGRRVRRRPQAVGRKEGRVKPFHGSEERAFHGGGRRSEPVRGERERGG